jgi:hypothetical protein
MDVLFYPSGSDQREIGELVGRSGGALQVAQSYLQALVEEFTENDVLASR